MNRIKTYYQLFGGILGITFLVWILRGLGVLTFVPGLVLWVLIFLSIAAGILMGWESSRRW
jgi:hypothetical protein